MNKNLLPHKPAIKAAILAGETYKTVAERYGVFTPEVHTLLRRDPDIVAAKAAGELRVRGRGKLTLDECLADPAVADVINGGMSTNAAAAKHGISQPTLWAKVKRARDLISPPKQPQALAQQDSEIIVIRALVRAYADRHDLPLLEVLRRLSD